MNCWLAGSSSPGAPVAGEHNLEQRWWQNLVGQVSLQWGGSMINSLEKLLIGKYACDIVAQNCNKRSWMAALESRMSCVKSFTWDHAQTQVRTFTWRYCETRDNQKDGNVTWEMYVEVLMCLAWSDSWPGAQTIKRLLNLLLHRLHVDRMLELMWTWTCDTGFEK